MHTVLPLDPHKKMSSLSRTGQSVNLIRDLFMSKHLFMSESFIEKNAISTELSNVH